MKNFVLLAASLIFKTEWGIHRYQLSSLETVHLQFQGRKTNENHKIY